MVFFVRWFLALPLLVAVAAPVHGATRNAPPYLRTSLEDGASAAQVVAPRRIRSTLDDASLTATRTSSESSSHAAFPADGAAKVSGRLIRLSLDDGQVTYGHLMQAPPPARRIRTSLD